DHSNTASQFGHALLQFFTVVIGRSVFDLTTDLVNTRFNRLRITSTIDDGGVLFGQNHALSLTQMGCISAFQAQTYFFRDHSTASQDGDVFQHGFTTVTKTRCFNRSHFNDTAHVVHDQGSQRFAFNVFSNDQQRTAGLGSSFQQGQHFADVGDFFINQQDQRVFELGAHVVLVVDEVRRQVTAVELHTCHILQCVGEAGTFFNSDAASLAYFFHCFSNDLAHIGVRVCRDGTY